MARRVYLQRREKYLIRKYGINLTQYNSLKRQQSNACGVCGKLATEEKLPLCVDHNHATGEIRGLLCNYCNRRVIGRHKDPDLFQKAADYLRKGTGWFVPVKKKKRKKRRRKS